MEGEVSRIGSIAKQTAIKNYQNNEVKKTITEYRELFDEQKGGSVIKRQQKYMSMVNSFYNMVTDIYEFGWGQSFHFAPRLIFYINFLKFFIFFQLNYYFFNFYLEFIFLYKILGINGKVLQQVLCVMKCI